MTRQWMKIIELIEVSADDVVAVRAGDRELAIYGVDGEVFATDNICTHGHARLCDGFVEGHEIECPLHQGRFDIRSGKAMCEPLTADIRTYPVKIENGSVYVDIWVTGETKGLQVRRKADRRHEKSSDETSVTLPMTCRDIIVEWRLPGGSFILHFVAGTPERRRFNADSAQFRPGIFLCT
ncbi:Ferredoxin subunit of nitrite reductase or a ring-hydroxylating dioxygenase [Burkholderia sp. D7]|nr:Ferredoxin subunit of nitrite reductase or a ring-hydroxylating dioxygenase [Burkholderia sp. D7]